MLESKTNPSRSSLLTAMACVGAMQGLSQIVLFRELMVLGGGSELSLGLSAAGWLVWAALGGVTGGRLGQRLGGWGLPLAIFFTGAAGILSLVLARIAPGIMGLALGQAHSLFSLSVLVLTVAAPAGLLAGANFPLILAAAGEVKNGARLLSRVFAFEALGAALAGLVFALALVHWLSPLAILLLAACLSSLIGLFCTFRAERGILWPWLLLLGLTLVYASPLEQTLREHLWRGHKLEAWKESPYAQLVKTSRDGQTNFFAGGAWLFSHPDRLRVERTALLPLLAAPSARRVMFIGGGPAGAAHEAARRGRLEKLTVVELDPWLWDLAQSELPQRMPQLEMRAVFGDGRLYLENASQGYDLVVLDLPPPTSMRLNRFYSREGFSALARALRPEGVAVLSLPGVEHLIGRLQAARLNTIINAARQVFNQVLIMSGPELRLFMSSTPGVIPQDPRIWVSRLEQKSWPRVAALRPDTLREELNPRRLAFLKAALDKEGPAEANEDLHPRALLYDSQLWGAYLGGHDWGARFLASLRPWSATAPLLGLLVFFALGGRFGPPILSTRLLPPLGMFCCGFTSMAASMLLFFAYQGLFGALYLNLALLITGYMAGTGLASFLAGYWLQRLRRPILGLISGGAALSLTCLISLFVIHLLHTSRGAGPWSWSLVGLAAILGAGTGIFFGLSGRQGLEQTAQPPSLAPLGGRLYGLDLAGGVAGALLPVLLMPSLGLYWALALTGLLNLLPVAGLAGLAWRQKAEL